MQYHIIFKTATTTEWLVGIVILSEIGDININFKLLSSQKKDNVFISRENDLILEKYRFSLINISFRRDSYQNMKYIFSLNQHKVPITIPSKQTQLKLCTINFFKLTDLDYEPNKDLLYNIKESKPNIVCLFSNIKNINDLLVLMVDISIISKTHQLYIINQCEDKILNLICNGSEDNNFLVHNLGNIVLVKSKLKSNLDELLNIIKNNVSKSTRQVIWLNNISIHTVPNTKYEKYKDLKFINLNYNEYQNDFRKYILENNIFKSVRLTLISNSNDTNISNFSHILESDLYQINVGTIYNNNISKIQTKISKAYLTKVYNYLDYKVQTILWYTINQDNTFISQFNPNYITIDEIDKDLLISCISINKKEKKKTHYININHHSNPFRFIQYIKKKIGFQYHI